MTKEEWKKLLYVHALKISKAKTAEETKVAISAAQQIERMAKAAGVDVTEEVQREVRSVYDLPPYDRTLKIAREGLP